MYSRIMIPVDLAHKETLDKAVTTAADLAKHYDAEVTMLGVTVSGPSEAAHTPEEFRERLEAYASQQGERLGLSIRAKAVVDPDPIADLHRILRDQVEEIGADLVVMASHVPHFGDYLVSSNAGYLASHADVSIFIVR